LTGPGPATNLRSERFIVGYRRRFERRTDRTNIAGPRVGPAMRGGLRP